MEESQVFSIPIEDIKIDVSMDPRGEERDHDVIERYVDNIDDLPPIVIDQDDHIIDGVHRYQAHLLAGRDTIQVKRQVIQDECEAFIASIKANSDHGQPLKPHHLRNAARRLYSQYGFPNNEIESVVKRGESTISNWLRALKQEWKAHVRETAYRMYEGTDEYVDKKTSESIRKREWTQERIAKHLSGPREKQIGTRTLRNHIEYRRDQLKAEKERQEEEARAAEEQPQPSHDSSDDAPAEEIATAAVDESAEMEEPSPEQDIPTPEIKQDDANATEDDGQKEAKTADDFIDVINQANELADNVERDKHTESQYMLLWLGEKMGLDLWIANNDRNKKYNGKELSSLFKTSPLPAQKYGEALETIEYIDVMWMKDDNIIAAFEVEESTGVYSGLLRLSDLKIVLSEPQLYIVSKKYSFRKVRQEINRPTFKSISLSEHCRYISYRLLVGEYNKVKQNSSPPDHWQQLLDDIAQKL